MGEALNIVVRVPASFTSTGPGGYVRGRMSGTPWPVSVGDWVVAYDDLEESEADARVIEIHGDIIRMEVKWETERDLPPGAPSATAVAAHKQHLRTIRDDSERFWGRLGQFGPPVSVWANSPVELLAEGAFEADLASNDHEMAEDDPGGLLGAVVARPEPQTLRLAVTYALLDGTNVIGPEHLRAAWAVWRYCRASAELIFGDALGDQHADRLLNEIRRAGRSGLSATDQSAVFGRNLPAKRLEAIRQRLENAGKVFTVNEESGGRPRIVSYDIRHAPPAA